jgi:hypothetical protein
LIFKVKLVKIEKFDIVNRENLDKLDQFIQPHEIDPFSRPLALNLSFQPKIDKPAD